MEFPFTPVRLPSTRDPRLPQFIMYDGNHPLWTHGKAYVYECDNDPEKQRTFSQFVQGRKVKEKFEKELEDAGDLRLFPGEAMFARKRGKVSYRIPPPLANYLIGASNPLEDMIQIYLHDQSLLPPGLKEKELVPLRMDILGDIEKRTGDKPILQEGVPKGGTAFERCIHRSFPVKKDTRCYQYMSFSTQKVKNLTAPNVNSKAPPDEGRKLRERMVKVSLLLLQIVQYLSQETRLSLRQRWLQLNWPPPLFGRLHTSGHL